MLTLGQASCLVLGYKPTDENRKKAKKQLQGTGLVAFHFRGQDPMRPAAIGLDVQERDPYTFLTYPPTPVLSPTETPLNDVIDDSDGSLNNSDDDCDDVQSNKDATNKANDNDKAPQGQKRKCDGAIIPYCKDRVLYILKTIATNVDPANESFFTHEFVTAAIQYEIMTEVFPNLQRHCNEAQLQYWVGQSKIWGPLKKLKKKGKQMYGRYLWVLRKEMRQSFFETSDSLSSYWQHVATNPDVITIGYARKSSTKETDFCRSHLLQLMVDKLHFRLKCEEVYVSPCCAANDEILNRDSPPITTILASLKGCQGDITDLTSRLHYLQKEVRLGIIDYAGLSTYPEDIINFLTAYPNVCEIAVDHGSNIEILSRFQLLKSNEVEKFNCRSAPVQRSK